MENNTKKEPILIYLKHADKTGNRIVVPKIVTDNVGYDFYVKIYPDYSMKFEPVKKSKEE